MRTRNRSSQVIAPLSRGRYKSTSTGWRPWWIQQSFADQSKTFSDAVRPGYFVKKKLGQPLPVGEMSSVELQQFIFTGSGSAEADVRNSSGIWLAGRYGLEAQDVIYYAQNLDTLPTPAVPLPNRDALVTKALANAQTNAWDVLTFAAEFNKTVDMLRTAQGRFWRHFQRVFTTAKRRYGTVSEATDVFSEVWLEYRFGLRPVIYDIEAIQEMLRRLREGSPALSRGWAQSSTEGSSSGASVSPNCTMVPFVGSTVGLGSTVTLPNNSAGTSRAWHQTLVHTGRASVGVEVTTRDLTLADPILTGWELTPWSVFVDYFLNIGDILAACSPAASGKLAYATYSLESVAEVTQTSVWTPRNSADVIWKGEFSPSTILTRKISKSRILVNPSPSLHLSFDLNVAQVFDLIAVAWGFRRRGTSLLKSLASRR